MQEDNDDTTFEGQEEDVNLHEQDAEQRADESVKEIQAIKEVKELATGHEEAGKNIAAFLRAKGLSEDLAKKLINTDLTDEYVRLLKALDFNDNDIENLRDLWRAKSQVSESDSADSSTIGDSSLDLSQNSLYLKNVLSKPLIEALREIIATKPVDPVEYLGHWLLNFKVCEEQSIHQKEEELELLINREKFIIKKVEDEEPVPIKRKEEEKEKEELDDEWSYLHYGEISQIDIVSDL